MPLRAERSAGAGSAFEARASRAEELAASPSIDPEPLRFAAGILRAQAEAAGAVERRHAERELSGELEQDLDSILELLLAVPRSVGRDGSIPVAAIARARAAEDRATARTRLLVAWRGGLSAADDFVSRAVLRPYFETLRILDVRPKRPHQRGRCPCCSGGAGVGRRESAESQGAVRSLFCASCGLEWGIARILCSVCSEDSPGRLPSFTSPDHPLERIEACETCRRYVKTMDTSLDRRIVPEVDDLTSLALDLWAREQGYERAEPGLAGN